MTVRLSPEEQVLVASLAGTPAAEVVDVERLDWGHLLGLARWHRLAPVLWHHLTSVDHTIVPPEPAVVWLKQAARESTARNLNLGMELDRALAVLEAEGIPVILLKGAALVETVYPHPGLRPMVDLDLLVPRADVERAHAALHALGYAPRDSAIERDHDAWLSTVHHHLPLLKTDGAVIVELHHQLLIDRPAFDVAALWARAVPGTRPPAHRLPSPEDLFLHVAAHFAIDRMNREQSALGQLADLVRIPQALDVDWDVLVARARDAALADRLFLALDAAALLGVEAAPREVLGSLRPSSYTRRRGEAFVRHRVLSLEKSLPLEQLAEGRSRLFPGKQTLGLYVRDDDERVPSRARLHARRISWLVRRTLRDAPHPVALVRDIRLSRWMVSLRS